MLAADLVAQAVPVVVVDEAGGDLALVDGGDDQLVVVVDLGVALDALEPGQSAAALPRRCAIEVMQRLEVGLARGDRDLALPLRRGEVEQRGRQVAVLDAGSCCRPAPRRGPRRRPRRACGELSALGTAFSVAAGTVASSPALCERLQGRRILGEEDVGGRARALLDDLIRERRLVGRANRDLDAGLLLEVGDELRDGLLVLAAVDRERTRCCAAVAAARRKCGRSCDKRSRRRRGKRRSPHGKRRLASLDTLGLPS